MSVNDYVMPKPNVQFDNMEQKAVADLAYIYWEARGRPIGSPQEDWFRAEYDLKKVRNWDLQIQGHDAAGAVPGSQK